MKARIIKEIKRIVYRHLVNVHKVDVDTLYSEFRSVKRKGVLGVCHKTTGTFELVK